VQGERPRTMQEPLPRWRDLVCWWEGDAGLLLGGERVVELPFVDDGVDVVAALLPALNLKVVADENVVEPVGTILG